jgi:hypothetical protein
MKVGLEEYALQLETLCSSARIHQPERCSHYFSVTCRYQALSQSSAAMEAFQLRQICDVQLFMTGCATVTSYRESIPGDMSESHQRIMQAHHHSPYAISVTKHENPIPCNLVNSRTSLLNRQMNRMGPSMPYCAGMHHSGAALGLFGAIFRERLSLCIGVKATLN